MTGGNRDGGKSEGLGEDFEQEVTEETEREEAQKNRSG